MVRFKSWQDFCEFLLEYKRCSCMNCVGHSYAKDGEHSDLFVCMKTLSPVRLSMITCCVEWTDKDGNTLKDFDGEDEWRIPNEIIKEIDKLNDVTFEEVTELIQMFEKEMDG